MKKFFALLLAICMVFTLTACGGSVDAGKLDEILSAVKDLETAVDNLACLCRHHHRLKHLPGWNLEHHPGGILTWTTPDGRRHETRPELAETG